MTAHHLGFAGQFCAGEFEFRVDEQRIVAEAVGAGAFETYVAFPCAAHHDLFSAGDDQRHAAAEAGRTLFEGDAFQLDEEFAIVAFVLALAFHGRPVFAVAGGIHAGSAAKGVHFKTGVVGCGGYAQSVRHSSGLDECVFFKGGAVFFYLGKILGQALHIEAEAGQRVAKLTHFALVARSEDERSGSGHSGLLAEQVFSWQKRGNAGLSRKQVLTCSEGTMLRIYSQSLGCAKTRVDTERLLGSLGPVLTVDDPLEADLVFLNTCAFIAPAVQESVQTILELVDDLSEMPKGRRPFFAVAGCLPGRYGIGDLSSEVPEVDLWLHTDDIDSWAEQLCKALKIETPAPGRLLSTGPSYAWLKIGEGCRHNCSFCAIPSIRGKYTSEAPEKLVTEASALVADGVKELILVAQDVTAYGTDFGKDPRFLLEKLLQIDGLERLRLLYLYPGGLSNDLLKFLSEAGKPFVPYFDMPLQHAHPDILRKMGRPFSGNPQEAVDRIRKWFPEAALRTTMMTGFPGETEEHFRTLMDFVERNRFHHMGVFAYQPEDGTEAAEMEGQLDDEIKEWRKDTLMELQSGISEDILSQYEGKRLDILVDEASDEWRGLYMGRAWFQAPEVDGITYVSGPGVEVGAVVEADITETREYDLIALA